MYRAPYKAEARATGAEINRVVDKPKTAQLDAKSKAREAASKLLGKSQTGSVHRPRGY